MSCVSVAFGGFVLDDDRFRIRDVRGWLDAPTASQDVSENGGSPGETDSPVMHRGRLVTVNGWCSSMSDRDLLIDELRAMSSPLVGAQDLIVTLAGRTLRARARLIGRTAEPVYWVGGRFDWSVTFRCPDPEILGPEVTLGPLQFPAPVAGSGLQYPLDYPLDYGTALGAGSQVFVPNPGTVPVWLRLRIDGPSPNPRVYVADTGSERRFGLTVDAEQWLDVLCKDRRVLANGVASRRYAVTGTGDWLAIPPGGATVGWDDDLHDTAARLWVWASEGAWI